MLFTFDLTVYKMFINLHLLLLLLLFCKQLSKFCLNIKIECYYIGCYLFHSLSIDILLMMINWCAFTQFCLVLIDYSHFMAVIRFAKKGTICCEFRVLASSNLCISRQTIVGDAFAVEADDQLRKKRDAEVIFR